jgi:hypothetical protein
MQRIQNWWLSLTIVGPLHMAEQLITGIDEYHMIKEQVVDGYYWFFAPADTDWATVLLVTIVWTFVSLLFYAVLKGGRPMLAVMGAFGAFGASEIHHVIEQVTKTVFEPGVLTSVPYSAVGVLMIIAVWQEFRRMTGKGSEQKFVQRAAA